MIFNQETKYYFKEAQKILREYNNYRIDLFGFRNINNQK